MASSAVMVIIIAAIAASIGFATFMYSEYQPNFILVEAGEPVQVGPVVYTIEHIGQHKGDKDIQPEQTFFQIQITAENLGSSITLLSGGQFYLLDESDKKHEAVFGDFSDEDLFNDNLKPNTQVTRTTQFDILYDEEKTYRIGILPTKEQSSNDIGIICVQNC